MNRRGFLSALVAACPELSKPDHDVGMHVEPECGQVIVTFSESIRYMHLTRQKARAMARLLLRAAGDQVYDS